jgi:glycolate oxidase iron-sulfur subunit
MQTTLPKSLLQTPAGREADTILRNCVHCGFCNATCPTYQLTGDELDGPRGRIYLIKQVLEGHAAGAKTRLHLDRCLTCRACETTCPSGVDYHRLLDAGRELVERQAPRALPERLLRWLLRQVLAHRSRFARLLRLGQWLRPVLPAALRVRIPVRQRLSPFAVRPQQERRVLLLNGCVQPALAPQINRAAIQVLDALGIGVVAEYGDGCCGALSHHLTATAEAGTFARHNIDTWWPHVERGIEAIVITASGCAPMVKDYGRLLADDPAYASRAERVSGLARDLSEVIAREQPWARLLAAPATRVAFQSPCTLQHGQRLNGVVEDLLTRCGFQLTRVADPHLCCGSAGTYSILQGHLAQTLRDRKLADLQADAPQLIATANIGCLAHLVTHSAVPVQHWVELLGTLLPGSNHDQPDPPAPR